MFYKKLGYIKNIEQAEKQCRDIFKAFPPSAVGTSSGKFSKHYTVWQFYKDSQLPLIKETIALLEKAKKEFLRAFPYKVFSYQFVQITRCLDGRKQLSTPHKDGYWYDGQFHLTVLGNGNISIWPGPRESQADKQLIWLENGTFWYLNGSRYYHTINRYARPTNHKAYERIEVLIPLDSHGNQKEKDKLKSAASKDKNRFFYPDNKKFIKLKKSQIQYALKAYAHNRASSPRPLGFIHNIKSLKEYVDNYFKTKK